MRRLLLVVALMAIIPALALPLLAGVAAFCLPAAVIAGIASLTMPAPVAVASHDHSVIHGNEQADFSR